MARLVLAELRRLGHRRLVLVTMTLTLLVLAAVGITAWRGTQPPTPAEQAAAQQAWRAAEQDWEQNKDVYIAQCQDSNAMARKYGGEQMECTKQNLGPTQPPTQGAPRPVTALTEPLPPLLTVALSGACLLVGASFVGAEFSTGNIGGWLLQEPRRSRVTLAKLLALVLGTLAFCLVTCLAALAGIWVVAELNGLSPGLTGPQQLSLLAALGRTTLFAVVAALGAAGTALLTRHTAAVMALVAAWLAASGVFGGSWERGVRFSLLTNTEAWVSGRAEYTVPVCGPGGVDCTYIPHVITRSDAALLLFGLAAMMVLLGWVSFSRRDVA